MALRDDILHSLSLMEALGSTMALRHLQAAANGASDANYLRQQYGEKGGCEGMVDAAIRRFRDTG